MYRARRIKRRGDAEAVAAPGVERADRELLRVLDRDFAEAARRAGAWLLCSPGCSDCCHGPFPITRLDVRRLRQGLAELRREDPPRAERLVRRAERAIAMLSDGFPGDPGSGRLTPETSRLDPYLQRHHALACPALDAGRGLCELYDWRPVPCRTFGPPLRFGGVSSPPCDLCFAGASREEVERCRVEPDRGALEQAILQRLGASQDEDWETLIPFALRAPERV